MPADPLPPPTSCPIGWQPHALAPVFYGRRGFGTHDGPPVRLALFFPSLDGAVETAPLLEGCARYPLVVFAHGHCEGDTDHFERWDHLPAQLARSGYVVAVPQLAGVGAGLHPSAEDHPDLATLTDLVSWLRTDWEHADVLDDGLGVVGHSFGALIGARFAVAAGTGAFAGLSGVWQDWSGPVPHPLTQLATATLFFWGDPLADLFAEIPNSTWEALPAPKHRAVWAQGGHWDYLVGTTAPCSPGPGSCGALGVATADLVTLFLGKYLPPELAVHLAEAIPDDLSLPEFSLTSEQQFFAGGHLSGLPAIEEDDACGLDQAQDPWPLVANRRSRETHSRTAPCAWVHLIAPSNRRYVHTRPEGYSWCDFCFPEMADG